MHVTQRIVDVVRQLGVASTQLQDTERRVQSDRRYLERSGYEGFRKERLRCSKAFSFPGQEKKKRICYSNSRARVTEKCMLMVRRFNALRARRTMTICVYKEELRGIRPPKGACLRRADLRLLWA